MSKYYSSKKIRKLGAIYNLIIGPRSNGKTYDWKENVLNDYTNKGHRGAYIRRYDTEIAPKNLATLFDSNDIERITKGKWNATDYKKHQFTLCIKVDGEIIMRDEQPFCDVYALNTWEASKGADRGYVSSICFDEFMTRRAYLTDEFVIFQNMLSSIIRDREDVIIFMLANTVNKYCPYFKEMGLHNVENMTPGDIELYTFGETGLSVAVEMCAESQNTKSVKKFYAFDNPQLEMITKGTWEVALYPHSPCEFTKYDILKRFYIIFNNKTIAGDIIKTSERFFIFYHMHTGNHEPDKNDIVYLEQNDGFYLHTKYLSDAPTDYHKLIAQLINHEREFYADNQIGEIIRNWKINSLAR
jgi:hypothetical protein